MPIKATFDCQHCGKPLKYEGEPVYCKCNENIGHTLVVVPVHGPNLNLIRDETDSDAETIEEEPDAEGRK